jgi:hypothetical protein
MKRFGLILILTLLGLTLRAQNVITAAVTVTNSTTNGMTFAVNANTWTWTNDFSNPCLEIVTNATIKGSTTNLWNSMILCTQSGVTFNWNQSNRVNVVALPGFSLSVVASGGYASVVYTTNVLIQATVVRVPPAAVGAYEKTNVESGLATYLGDSAGTNQVNTNAPMFLPWYIWIASLSTNGAANMIWTYDVADDVFWNNRTIGSPIPSYVPHSFVLFGNSNVISAGGGTLGYDAIFSGNFNRVNVTGPYNFILGGYTNYNAGFGYSWIGNGASNSVNSFQYEFILDGLQNYGHGDCTWVGNGQGNRIQGDSAGAPFSLIGNGRGNTIIDGSGYSTIENGLSNTVSGTYSTASGVRANVQHNSDWMWADNQSNQFTSFTSNTFLIRAQHGVGINTNNPANYSLNVNGSGNFSALYVNDIPVGSGGGGGGGTNTTSGVVQSLFVAQPTVANFLVTNVILAGSGVPLDNGTYVPFSSDTFILNYGGNNYTIYSVYQNQNGIYFGWTNFAGSYWRVNSSISLPISGSYINNIFNLLDPGFNNSAATSGSGWGPVIGMPAPFPTMTPTLSTLPSIYPGNITVTWGQGDNWEIPIQGTNSMAVTLAQDWKATVANQVEYHKIFLFSSTNATLSFPQGTNQWIWQNRQGLPASAPVQISSNETITINIAHWGTATNWLTTWDTSIAADRVKNGYIFQPQYTSGGTNYYVWDLGGLNPAAQPIYASLTASAPSYFLGVTNGIKWGLLSFNVVASGGNQVIAVADTLPHFNTNGWSHVSGTYYFTLTNGNEFRMTVQSNSTLSTTWQTFGQ